MVGTRNRLAGLVALILTLAVLPVPGSPAAAAEAALGTVLDGLVVQDEVTAGYDRDYFDHWIDADFNGCDTREEVLIVESVVTPSTGAGCSVTGQWFSTYDGETWTEPSDVDVDHVVALSEAWGSGAHAWTFEQRRAFANDLDFDRSLIAVTDNVNASKGDRDPAEWMPPATSYHCTYATDWILVKHRWRLTIDALEKTALSTLVTDCGNPVVTLPTRADVPDPQPPTAPFPDVPLSHPFVADISWMITTGLTTGYPDGTFRGGAPVSRQALAAMLYRYSTGNDNPPGCSQQWYWDVPTSSRFCGHIRWLSRAGLAQGYADGSFRPTAPVSRQAMAVILHRYRKTAGSLPDFCAPMFSDMPGGTFCSGITWVASEGIANGYDDGTFKPTAPVSRQALAAFLHRYDTRFGPSSPPLWVPDPPPPTTTTTRPPTTTTTSGVPPNPGDTKNCGDFPNWAAAQAWFNYYFPWYGDVARLDSDRDGIACESLPGAP